MSCYKNELNIKIFQEDIFYRQHLLKYIINYILYIRDICDYHEIIYDQIFRQYRIQVNNRIDEIINQEVNNFKLFIIYGQTILEYWEINFYIIDSTDIDKSIISNFYHNIYYKEILNEQLHIIDQYIRSRQIYKYNSLHYRLEIENLKNENLYLEVINILISAFQNLN